MIEDIILDIDSVTKSFIKNRVNVHGESEDERFLIIDNVDLNVRKGEIKALIGGNGTGKTTLFNIISGFVESDAGNILYKINGSSTNLIKKKPHEIARLGIGRMFQDNHIFQNISVLDNMLIAASDSSGELPYTSMFRLKKNKEMEENNKEKAKNIFDDLFGINNPFWEKRNNYAKDLSYGQQRLLGLARLLMGDYKLLLLDEPTAGVNPSIIQQSMDIIKSFVTDRDLTVFFIEHNVKVVLTMSDFCFYMSHGRIKYRGTPEDVLGNEEVRKGFMGLDA